MMSRKRKVADFNKTKIIQNPVGDTRSTWSDGELMSLVVGIQRYGLSNTKKIAEVVTTRDENAVKYFLASESAKVKATMIKAGQITNRGGISARPKLDELKRWPISRKWKKMIYDQMLHCVKKQDYSKIVMADLFKTFYEEAEEPSDPQVINCKAIYKFLMECTEGKLPGELSPIDSGVVLLMMKKLDEIITTNDFDEELSFIQNFKRAKTFVPFQVKDEFRKRTIQRSANLQNAAQSTASACNSTGTPQNDVQSVASTSKGESDIGSKSLNVEERDAIKVTEDMYVKLSKHRKLVQSMNPLNIPMWLLIKEQAYIQNVTELTARPFTRQETATENT